MNRIKELRISHDLTQEQLGKLVGVSKQAVFKWESGKVPNIPREKQERMAELFGCSVDYLMNFESSNTKEYYFDPAAESIASFLMDRPEYKVLFDASRKVKPEDIEKVAQMIKLMTGE